MRQENEQYAYYAARLQQQRAGQQQALQGPEVQQGSEAWHRLREGRLTASATAEAAGFFSVGQMAERIIDSECAATRCDALAAECWMVLSRTGQSWVARAVCQEVRVHGVVDGCRRVHQKCRHCCDPS